MTRAAPQKTPHLVPRASAMLEAALRATLAGTAIDRAEVRALAAEVLAQAKAGTFALGQRSYSKGTADHAEHATNVAFVTAALALELGHSDAASVEITAAALLHDLGHLLLGADVAGVPEPLLDDAGRAEHRRHAVLGARALLAAGCPPLWIAAALEHHRGVDGKGYPALASGEGPAGAVGLVGLASYIDRKRAAIDGRADEPEQVWAAALALEGRYFETGLVGRLIRAIGVFPPGTTVELSSRDPALVVRANPAEPLRPRVIVLSGTNVGRRLDLSAVDAVERRYASSIVRAIPPPLLVRPKSVSATRARATDAPPPESEPPKSVQPKSVRPDSVRSPPLERPAARRRDRRTEDGRDAPSKEAVEAARAIERPKPPATRVVHVPLGPEAVLEITANPAHLATLSLEARERLVLTRLDGHATLAEIAGLLKLSDARLLPIAARLLARGVVRRR